MDRKEFTEKLKQVGLSKKKFAGMVSIKYDSVLGWGRKYKNNSQNSDLNYKISKVPAWIDSWLENYSKAQKFDNLQKLRQEEAKLIRIE